MKKYWQDCPSFLLYYIYVYIGHLHGQADQHLIYKLIAAVGLVCPEYVFSHMRSPMHSFLPRTGGSHFGAGHFAHAPGKEQGLRIRHLRQQVC